MRQNHEESIDLIVDSTGLSFGKASHWYETKYNKPCNNKPWKKMHISIDPEMNVHAIEIPDYEISDIEGLDKLIPEGLEIEKLIADGEYYIVLLVLNA